jgi:hypothetical protein
MLKMMRKFFIQIKELGSEFFAIYAFEYCTIYVTCYFVIYELAFKVP